MARWACHIDGQRRSTDNNEPAPTDDDNSSSTDDDAPPTDDNEPPTDDHIPHMDDNGPLWTTTPHTDDDPTHPDDHERRSPTTNDHPPTHERQPLIMNDDHPPDTDYQPHLCVPLAKRRLLLEEAHEQAYESAHQGPEKLWQKLSGRFYWKRMKADMMKFVQTCNVCQKVKHPNFNKYGYLIPNPIPSRPYQSISMDFIVNLPWSEGYNVIHVTVD